MNFFKDMELTKEGKKVIGLAVAIFVLAIIIFFGIFFQVKEVEITGNTYYSEKEIESNILKGPLAYNSLFAPILCSNKDISKLPFIRGYVVQRINRNTLQLRVDEKKIVGCFFYLDNYIYFDRNGIFVMSSQNRDENVPLFEGVEVNKVVMNKELPIKKSGVLGVAVALTTIFQKNEMVPDNIQFNQNNQIELIYGDIKIMLGDSEYIEDKMNRALAILPLISDKKGVLHLENVTNSVKTITFEMDEEEVLKMQWKGGYDENGEYTGEGEYDEYGNYVGPFQADSEEQVPSEQESSEDYYSDELYSEENYETDSYYTDSYYTDSYYTDDYYTDSYYTESYY